VTLKEIAAEAGVSVSTVSRVVNSRDDSFASREVRDRVWNIVRKTGYLPNKTARELRWGKNAQPVQGGLLCCILGRTDAAEGSPFLSQISRVTEKQALDMGYPLRFSYSIFHMGEKLMTNVIRQRIESFKPNGVIAIGEFSSCAVDLINRHYANVIYIGRSRIDTAWDQVICDAREAAEIALNHLYAKGHRKIGYLGMTGREPRHDAYRDFLTRRGLSIPEQWVFECEHSAEGGNAGARKLIGLSGERPTAVFCACDSAAIALTNRLKDAKIHVPEQVSIIGLDNIELSGYVSPMLSSVGMPVQEMGVVAVQTLISRMEGRHKKALRVYLPNEIYIRQSVAPVPVAR